ncbi:hypothetical protein M1D72_14130 [Vibrio sp. AK197]
MLAALPFKRLKLAKWFGLVLVGVIMVSMWLMLKASRAEQMALRARLEKALVTNQVSKTTIDALTKQSEAANRLLVERARAQSEKEAKLNDDIQHLRDRLNDEPCYQKPWPRDVTERLREPY